MARRDVVGVPGLVRHLGPVVHHDGHGAGHHDALVRGQARVRAHEGLDALAPLPAGLNGELAHLEGLVSDGLDVRLRAGRCGCERASGGRERGKASVNPVRLGSV